MNISRAKAVTLLVAHKAQYRGYASFWSGKRIEMMLNLTPVRIDQYDTFKGTLCGFKRNGSEYRYDNGDYCLLITTNDGRQHIAIGRFEQGMTYIYTLKRR